MFPRLFYIYLVVLLLAWLEYAVMSIPGTTKHSLCNYLDLAPSNKVVQCTEFVLLVIWLSKKDQLMLVWIYFMHRWMFVTKPSMARHHYKPERHMRKMGFIFKVMVTEFWFIQSNMIISILCSELLIFWGDQLSLTVNVHKLECLVKRLLCCIQGQGHSEGSELQWMFAWTISLIGQT